MKELDIRDALSWIFVILFAFIASVPEPTYYTLLEGYLWARVLLLLGLGFAVFFQGMKQENSPLLLDLILMVISLAWTALLWGTFSAYTRIPGATTELNWSGVLGIFAFIIGNTAFYGFGALCNRAIEEIKS